MYNGSTADWCALEVLDGGYGGGYGGGKGGGGGGKGSGCFKCGAQDHWSRECPQGGGGGW